MNKYLIRATIEMVINADSEDDAIEIVYDDTNLDLNDSDVMDVKIIREII